VNSREARMAKRFGGRADLLKPNVFAPSIYAYEAAVQVG
jgi:hypothetical protein